MRKGMGGVRMDEKGYGRCQDGFNSISLDT